MNTRKKIAKPVYKDEESEDSDAGDFSASESEAELAEATASEEDSDDSGEAFIESPSKKKRVQPAVGRRKQNFSKWFLSGLAQRTARAEEDGDLEAPTFSVKDLTEENKLLPAVLNLSESDSSDNEQHSLKKTAAPSLSSLCLGTSKAPLQPSSDSESEVPSGYTDVWSKNLQVSSEEVALKSFQQLKKHTDMMRDTRETINRYCGAKQTCGTDVDGLLALGELQERSCDVKRAKSTDSEMEDWEEVKDSKPIPQSGIQLVVDFPGATTKKSKQLDVEMMMRRKINRVKKEYQVYMHKVHVLSWLAHGNYVNTVINDQHVMAAALSLLPSEKCYPSERVNLNYLIEISQWFREKINLEPDKHENKFKPNAPPLREILLKQIKNQTVTSSKILCYVFVSMLRALGINCRIMINFVTLPIRPPSSELCSLATKHKDQPDTKPSTSSVTKSKLSNKSKLKIKNKQSTRTKEKSVIPQIDGNDDSISSLSTLSDSNDCGGGIFIMQLDGSDDCDVKMKRSTRSSRLSLKAPNIKGVHEDDKNVDVSPPKRPKRAVTKTERPSECKSNSESSGKSSKQNVNVIKRKSPKPQVIKQKNNTDEKLSNLKVKSVKSRDSNRSNAESLLDPKEEKKLQDKVRRSKINKNKTKDDIKCSNSTIENGSTADTGCDNAHCDDKNIAKALVKSSHEKSNPVLPTNKSSNSRSTKHSKVIGIKSLNNSEHISSEFFLDPTKTPKVISSSLEELVVNENLSLSRKRERTSSPGFSRDTEKSNVKSSSNLSLKTLVKARTRSAPCKPVQTSKYFESTQEKEKAKVKPAITRRNKEEDSKRVCHRDLLVKSSNKVGSLDVKKDLVSLIKGRVKEAKRDTIKKKIKGKVKEESEDSDYLPEDSKKRASSEDFRPTVVRPKLTARRLDRRVLSTDDEGSKKKLGIDVWCEVFVEEIEQWVPVDVVKPQVHCAAEIYSRATHPVAYIVGWDNNNRLKDLTRRYVPHWNTVTRKLRAEPAWWSEALRPWLGQSGLRDREEDEQLDRIMFDAPLPKIIAEYKNHPLYALKRHLLKFEVLYPDDAPLGFVRGEAVYARACVHTCRSRDTWLKEAKTVRRGELPYKVVKARPKWDKLSNKAITDIPLEVFGPWQVEDYEPPTAEGGVVPRNAYGNVELFKECMLPKGTVHIKLAGLNKTAKKLNIDCAPAMTGFDFHGGWTHPVFDGFVVCAEFEELLTDAWIKDQEEMERREREKLESRVYGNWKRLIKGLLIRERLQRKYAFGDGAAAPAKGKKPKGPRLLVKK